MVREAVASDGWSALGRPLERALGKRTAAALAKLELRTVGDLLGHSPFRLAHRGELMPLADVREGEAATVIARVTDSRMRPMNSRRGYILTVRIADGALSRPLRLSQTTGECRMPPPRSLGHETQPRLQLTGCRHLAHARRSTLSRQSTRRHVAV